MRGNTVRESDLDSIERTFGRANLETLYPAMSRALVCEGNCSPTLKEFEEVTLLARECFMDGDPFEAERIRFAQRGVRHTEHVRVRTDFFACIVCGCERRYGHEIVGL